MKAKKAVILAAGKGTRMLPLTENMPKHIIKINGKPFLYYILRSLKDAGYEKIGVLVNYKKEQIVDYLKTCPEFDTEIIEQEGIKGSADAVRQMKDFVGEENFLVLGGDNLWSAEDLARVNRDDDYVYIMSHKVDDPSKYGVLVTEGEKLIRIHEKPQEFVGDLINTGLYRFTPDIFEAISKTELGYRGEYEIVDAISILAKDEKVKVLTLNDFWLDLGCPDDIPKVEEFLKQEAIV